MRNKEEYSENNVQPAYFSLSVNWLAKSIGFLFDGSGMTCQVTLLQVGGSSQFPDLSCFSLVCPHRTFITCDLVTGISSRKESSVFLLLAISTGIDKETVINPLVDIFSIVYIFWANVWEMVLIDIDTRKEGMSLKNFLLIMVRFLAWFG